jgi:hypothetical protein
MKYQWDNVNAWTGRMPYNAISSGYFWLRHDLSDVWNGSAALQKILNEIRLWERVMMFIYPNPNLG